MGILSTPRVTAGDECLYLFSRTATHCHISYFLIKIPSGEDKEPLRDGQEAGPRGLHVQFVLSPCLERKLSLQE